MDEPGVVIEAGKGWARVRVEPTELCSKCAARAVCMVGDDTHRVIEVDNPIGAIPEQRVTISVKPAVALGAGAIVYVMPIAALILGAVAGTRLAGHLALPVDPDLSGALVGLAGLALSLILVRVIDAFSRRRSTFRPSITGIVEEHGQGGETA